MSINSKAGIGVGAFGILTGAVCLRIDPEIWGIYRFNSLGHVPHS